MKAARRYVIGEPPPIDPNKIITMVKFVSAPVAATASTLPRKYGKKNHWAFEWDDASMGAYVAYSTIFNTAMYTDGCGNNINYSGTVGINGRNETSGDYYTYEEDNGRLLLTYMLLMIAAGFDFSDHGLFHDKVGFGASITPLQNTQQMQTYMKSLLNYWTRTKIVPNDDEGEAQAAFDCDYVYSTSQGQHDTFTPEWQFAPPGDLDNIEFALGRFFTDDWAGSLAELKSIFDGMASQTNKFVRVASHVINETEFQELVTYIETNANDEFLVCSTREVLEYKEMTSAPITQSLVGDTLTIETDISGLDPKIRWKDQSFSIDADQEILSVTTIGGDSASFNNTTGLVNVFKQINQWL